MNGGDACWRLVDDRWVNGPFAHSGPIGCPTPVGAWGQLGTTLTALTSTNRRFSTIHTPYCSLFF